MNRRRDLIFLAGAAALAPRVPLAQPLRATGKLWRIGFIVPGRGAPDSSNALREGLRELGYVEGRNIVIESRLAGGDAARLPALAAELARIKPDVIVAATPAVTGAVQKATAAIPIVMVNVTDPVEAGFVRSLARPGGNITGVSTRIGELGPKQLELLREMVPGLARVAVLLHPDEPSHHRILKSVQDAAPRMGMEVLPAEVRGELEIETAIAAASRQGARAVVVMAGLLATHRRRIAEMAAKHRLPSIAAARQYAEAGGLMSYGPDPIEPYRRAAFYVDRILKGAHPGDLPVEEPTRFTFLVNAGAARALGLTLPQSILVRADRVIE
ncbi:MAG: ABC transporter substrate-binding protein [Burkholderiales bacterium]|nr:ABC transporter substrate-binding protein [Burkholderiales bacterium]